MRVRVYVAKQETGGVDECWDECVNKLVSLRVHTFCICRLKAQGTTHAFLITRNLKGGLFCVHFHVYMHAYLWACVCVLVCERERKSGCIHVWNPLAGSASSVEEYIPGKSAATPVITANSIRGASAAEPVLFWEMQHVCTFKHCRLDSRFNWISQNKVYLISF